jgi:hypothetical protein
MRTPARSGRRVAFKAQAGGRRGSLPISVAQLGPRGLRCSRADAEVKGHPEGRRTRVASRRKLQQLEFEMALTGVLSDVYDLAVRSDRDPLERRGRGLVTLHFDYEYDGKQAAKVCVSIVGQDSSTFSLPVDFSNTETILESAEQCEDLALAVQSRMDDLGFDADALDRRWMD